jgi:hypothetical protein
METKVKLVKAPIHNYDVKNDSLRKNKELIEAGPTFKQPGFTAN